MAPLIARLSTNVQGRVLQSAALVLEKSNKLWQQQSQLQAGESGHRQKADSDKESRFDYIVGSALLADKSGSNEVFSGDSVVCINVVMLPQQLLLMLNYVVRGSSGGGVNYPPPELLWFGW